MSITTPMQVAQANIQQVMSPVSSADGYIFGFTKDALSDVKLLGLWSAYFLQELPTINEYLGRYYLVGPQALKDDFPAATQTDNDLNELANYCDKELSKLVMKGTNPAVMRNVKLSTRTEIWDAFDKYSLDDWNFGLKHFATARFIKTQRHTVCPSRVYLLDTFAFSTSPQVGLLVTYLYKGLSMDELRYFCLEWNADNNPINELKTRAETQMFVGRISLLLSLATEAGKKRVAKAKNRRASRFRRDHKEGKVAKRSKSSPSSSLEITSYPTDSAYAYVKLYSTPNLHVVNDKRAFGILPQTRNGLVKASHSITAEGTEDVFIE